MPCLPCLSEACSTFALPRPRHVQPQLGRLSAGCQGSGSAQLAVSNTLIHPCRRCGKRLLRRCVGPPQCSL